MLDASWTFGCNEVEPAAVEPKRILPDDAVAFVQECVRARRILWTYHVNLRLKGRFISRQAILEAVDTYELIEAYPDDKYLPSYLLLAISADGPIHILFATDVADNNIRVVTAYRPSPDEWERDFKTRRAR